jgi:ribose transport system permease protein
MSIDTLTAPVSDADATRRRLRWPSSGPVAVITVGLFVLSWFMAPGSVSKSAIDSLLPYAGILAISAVGQTIVVMLRGIDMSVPGMVSLGALVSSKYAADHNDDVSAAVLVVLVIAVAVGVVNGVIITGFNVTPLVATLAVNAGLMGAAIAYTGGSPSRAPDVVASFALDRTLGLSNTVWLAVVLVAGVAVATSRTTWGRRLAAVGSNDKAAHGAGIRVTLV